MVELLFCFSLHKILLYGWESLLVNYWDIFISCLDSHFDSTDSLQRIHWWASDFWKWLCQLLMHLREKDTGAERGCEPRPVSRKQSSSREGSGLGGLLTSRPRLTTVWASMAVSSGSGAHESSSNTSSACWRPRHWRQRSSPSSTERKQPRPRGHGRKGSKNLMSGCTCCPFIHVCTGSGSGIQNPQANFIGVFNSLRWLGLPSKSTMSSWHNTEWPTDREQNHLHLGWPA